MKAESSGQKYTERHRVLPKPTCPCATATQCMKNYFLIEHLNRPHVHIQKAAGKNKNRNQQKDYGR
jgi:hypothetical protein